MRALSFAELCQKKKGIGCFFSLLEDFPNNSSYYSANYWSDPKDPKLTQRSAAYNKCWS
jgi:hypothetical protein